jgi:SH3-like domain-containing protein
MESEGNWVNLRLPDGAEGWVFKAYVKKEDNT